ncbi:hypothetical protein GCM10020367_61330 [Streptomyces sannanensis]|uniref:Uncharacterized protein n=1 Tax=Streptomyces sannanensis TaxID=285536 RepID=A0ABP6SKC1_9ACTN
MPDTTPQTNSVRSAARRERRPTDRPTRAEAWFPYPPGTALIIFDLPSSAMSGPHNDGITKQLRKFLRMRAPACVPERRRIGI